MEYKLRFFKVSHHDLCVRCSSRLAICTTPMMCFALYLHRWSLRETQVLHLKHITRALIPHEDAGEAV